MCPESESNRHDLRHRFLRPTRLPVPPSGQKNLYSALIKYFKYYGNNSNIVEDVGFEPTILETSKIVFETIALNHSANPLYVNPKR